MCVCVCVCVCVCGHKNTEDNILAKHSFYVRLHIQRGDCRELSVSKNLILGHENEAEEQASSLKVLFSV